MPEPNEKPREGTNLPIPNLLSKILDLLGKNMKLFGRGTRNAIGIFLVLVFGAVFVVFSFHAFAPTYVLGRLTIKTSKNGPLRFAKDYVLTTGESEIVVDKFGRWVLPLRGFLPSRIKITVHNPNKPGTEFARFELLEPIPIRSAISVSEPEVTIHTYRKENQVEIVNRQSQDMPFTSYSLAGSRKHYSAMQQKLVLVVHLQDIGDVYCEGSDWCGTIGENRRMEGFAMMETGIPDGVAVEYMGHLEGTGDTQWMQQRSFCGTRGKGQRLEGVAFRLVGPRVDAYTVKYQVHLKNLGTSQIFQDGQFAGTRGQARAVEAIRAWIEKR